MKIKIIFLCFCVCSLLANAQSSAPQLINYQAIIRGSAGTPLPNKTIKIVFDLHEAGASGPIIFNEVQTVTTNSLGLFSTQIGKVSSLAVVNWTNGPYYLDLLVDTTGGSNFVMVGAQQLVSTPFALYAEKAGSAPGPAVSFSNNTLFVGTSSVSLPPPAPDQTVTISSTGNAQVTSAYPAFTVGVLPQVLSINSNSITLSNGGGTITLPATSTTPNTSITAAGIASVSTSGTNTFNIGVQTPTLNGSGGTTVSGTYPNFTISSPTLAPVITPTINGAGIATVSPSSGNNFTVNVAPAALLGVGGTTVGGTYPNFTIGSPNYSISFPNPATAVLTNGLNSNTASIPQNTLTGNSGITVTGSGPTYTLGTATNGTNTLWNTLGNSGTSPSVNFLGTTDPIDLQFRTANVARMKISSVGNIGMGTPLLPAENLQVESGATTKLSVISPSTSLAGLLFGTPSNHGLGLIQYNNATNEMNFGTGGASNRLRLFGNGEAAFGSTLTANPVSSFVNFCRQGANDTKVLISGGDNSNSWGGLLAFGENETASQGMTIKLDAGGNRLLITNDINGTSPVVGIGGYSGATNGVMIGTGYAFGNAPVDGLAVQGNVGVGVSSPTQKLEVAGNVVIPGANNYLYATAKTQYLSIASVAFRSEAPTAYECTFLSGCMYPSGTTPGTATYFDAAISLPDGATVTAMDAYIVDNDANYNASGVWLWQQPGAIGTSYGSPVIMGNTPATAGQNSTVQKFSTTTFSPNVINNALNSYYIRVGLAQATTVGDIRIAKVVVTYSVIKTD